MPITPRPPTRPVAKAMNGPRAAFVHQPDETKLVAEADGKKRGEGPRSLAKNCEYCHQGSVGHTANFFTGVQGGPVRELPLKRAWRNDVRSHLQAGSRFRRSARMVHIITFTKDILPTLLRDPRPASRWSLLYIRTDRVRAKSARMRVIFSLHTIRRHFAVLQCTRYRDGCLWLALH